MSIDPSGPPPISLTATDPTRGCARCGAQQTVQLHPYRGRLFPRHAELPAAPPGSYRPDFAEHLVVEYHRPSTAFAYLAVCLAREIDRRFAAAVSALGPTLRFGDYVAQRRRCWCGRTISPATPDEVFCAEHDGDHTVRA